MEISSKVTALFKSGEQPASKISVLLTPSKILVRAVHLQLYRQVYNLAPVTNSTQGGGYGSLRYLRFFSSGDFSWGKRFSPSG